MKLRREADSRVRARLLDVSQRQSNEQGNVHGGAILTLIDVGIFMTARLVIGEAVNGSVTLDLHNQFIGAGQIGQPLDVLTEVLRETGRMIFLAGKVEQGDHLVSSFMATLRKPSRK